MKGVFLDAASCGFFFCFLFLFLNEVKFRNKNINQTRSDTFLGAFCFVGLKQQARVYSLP